MYMFKYISTSSRWVIAEQGGLRELLGIWLVETRGLFIHSQRVYIMVTRVSSCREESNRWLLMETKMAKTIWPWTWQHPNLPTSLKF